MNAKSTTHSKFVYSGLVLSLLVFVVHFCFIERVIHDHRLTFSLSTEEFDAIKPHLNNYRNHIRDNDFLISPNFHAIADTLESSGIKRFELKLSTPDSINIKECTTTYFQYKLISPAPDLIKKLRFKDSTPLQKSIGYGVLTMCFFLLVDFVLIRYRSNK